MEERFTALFTTMGEVSGRWVNALCRQTGLLRSCKLAVQLQTAEGVRHGAGWLSAEEQSWASLSGAPARRIRCPAAPPPLAPRCRATPPPRRPLQVLQRLNEHLDGAARLSGAEYEDLVGRLEGSMGAASAYVR